MTVKREECAAAESSETHKKHKLKEMEQRTISTSILMTLTELCQKRDF